MSIAYAKKNLTHYINNIINVQPHISEQDFFNTLAFNKFHDNTKQIFVFNKTIDGHNIRMKQLCMILGFAFKSFCKFRIIDHFKSKEFDCNESVKFFITGFINNAHSAFSKNRKDLIIFYFVTD